MLRKRKTDYTSEFRYLLIMIVMYAYLEHLDAHKCVEGLLELRWELTIVHEVHTDATFEPGCLDTFLGQCLLFN